MTSTHSSINSGDQKNGPTQEHIRSTADVATSVAPAQISRGRARLLGLLFVGGVSLVVWLFAALLFSK